jgi:hypothetical protein
MDPSFLLGSEFTKGPSIETFMLSFWRSPKPPGIAFSMVGSRTFRLREERPPPPLEESLGSGTATFARFVTQQSKLPEPFPSGHGLRETFTK